MKKVYVFGTRGFPNVQGGVEKHCEQLYAELADAYEIYVFRRKPYLAKQAAGSSPIHFIDLPSTRIKGFESFFHSFLCTLFCILKRPDIVHIHNIGPGMFIPLLKMARLKVVLTYHSANYEHKKWNYITRKILKFSEWIATRGADAIIFVNINQLNKFDGTIKAKSTYIPNGVTIRSRAQSTQLIEAMQIIPQKYILAVGRITQEKGFDYLVDAFLQSNIKGYQLVIAGGIDHASAYAKDLIQKAQAHDNVILTGYADGEFLCQLYSHCKLFVLPSYSEGFPLVLLEAMSYALPILASDIPANRQIELKPEYYFQAGNIAELAHKMAGKIEDDFPVCYDLTNYTWKNVAAKTEQVYTQFCS